MINWQKTTETYGITDFGSINVKSRQRVCVTCDVCGVDGTKTIRSKKDIENNAYWLCRKCIVHQPEARKNILDALIKFNKREYSDETKQKMSNNMKKKWKDNEYKEKMSKVNSESAKKSWNNDEYREKITNKTKENWNNNEYREKITTKSKENWCNDGYREKLRKIQSSDEYRAKISEALKMKMKENEYAEYAKYKKVYGKEKLRFIYNR